MDELSSTEFRKSFARLTEPVLVTVNGHVIGQWRPMEVKYQYEGSTVVTIGGKDKGSSMPAAWANSQPAPKVRKP